jgi:hypothetical protein
MPDPRNPHVLELPPVPPLLFSAFEEGPFKACVVCGADLTAPQTTYQIQKTWKRGEVTFELAVCAACAGMAAKDFSKESLERISQFLADRYRPSLDLGHCHTCRQRLDGGEPAEFEVGGYCRGARLLRPVVIVCATCSEAAQENLSAQTRKAWGDFVDRNLPGVPQSLEPDSVPMIF